jgi:hypothetical protein
MKAISLFGRNKLVPISKLNVELISLHIPKTGGTSFHSLLHKNYGEKNVVRFEIEFKDKVIFLINGIEVDEPLFPKGTKVLHGHFEYWRLLEFAPNLKNVPVITWLRNPVQRVISNYYYLVEILKKENATNKLALSLIERLTCSLEEFSKRPAQKNKMSKFLKGLNLMDALFVGIIENYDQDVKILSKKLNWKHENQEIVNKTPNKKSNTDATTIHNIEKNNAEDISLYNQITKLSK